jgi:hypothetical protein
MNYISVGPGCLSLRSLILTVWHGRLAELPVSAMTGPFMWPVAHWLWCCASPSRPAPTRPSIIEIACLVFFNPRPTRTGDSMGSLGSDKPGVMNSARAERAVPRRS